MKQRAIRTRVIFEQGWIESDTDIEVKDVTHRLTLDGILPMANTDLTLKNTKLVKLAADCVARDLQDPELLQMVIDKCQVLEVHVPSSRDETRKRIES